MIIRCLGAVGAVHDGEFTPISRSQRRIVSMLSAAGPDGLNSAAFADELWLEDLPGDWESAVRMAVSRLRRALPAGAIASKGGTYRLTLDARDVDVWALLEPPSSDAVTDERANQMLQGEPYPDLDISPLLRASIESVHAARVQLIEWMTAETQILWSRTTLQTTENLARRHLFREDLLLGVAKLHVASGDEPAARRLLQSGVEYITNEMVAEPMAATTELLGKLTDTAGSNDATTTDDPVPEPRVVGSVQPLQSGHIARVDLELQLTSAIAQYGAVLEGEPGSGKTVTANAQALDLIDRGNHIVSMCATRDARSVYGPFLAIDPTVAQALEPLLEDGGDTFSRSRSWLGVLRALHASLPDLPIVIVVDDAQWLDSHSQRLVEFIASSRSSTRISLLVAGRPDPKGPGWAEFAENLQRSGLLPVTATDFEASELSSLIGRQFPASTSKQRIDLAAQLAAIRATSPAIAWELVRRADPTTLVLPPIAIDSPTISTWTNHISDEAHRVGSIAAVLGMGFRIEDVAELGELPVGAVIEAIDEMLDANVLSAEQRPDEFTFRHVLVHRAFDDSLSRSERRALHLRAAATTTDIHARALHLHSTGGLAKSSDTTATLVESARMHMQTGSFSEAVAAFAIADSYGQAALDPRGLLDYANAIGFSGGDGWRIRDRAFAAAIGSNAEELAIEVAISSALETEDITGDPRRTAMLRAIPDGSLDQASQLARDTALARELGLLGQHDEAFALAVRCAANATSPDEALHAWLGAWPSTISTAVNVWPPLPLDCDEVTDPELQSRLAQTETLRALLEGRTTDARHNLEQFRTRPYTTTSGLRSWYVKLFESTFHFLEGNWDSANSIADQALAHGQQHGIADAFSTRAAQLFSQHWICGTHESLLPLLDMAAPDVGSSILAEAAYATALAEVPTRHDQAHGITRRLCEQLQHDRGALTAPAAVLLASIHSNNVVGDLRPALLKVLLPFAGTHIVVGSGVGSLGPATRSLAWLAETPEDRTKYLQTAIEESDTWSLPVWSIRCRLDLAELTGDSLLREQARALAPNNPVTAQLFNE